MNQVLRLKNVIAEHCGASEILELGFLTDTEEYVNNHPRLLRSLRFGDDDFEGCVLEWLSQVRSIDPKKLDEIEAYVHQKFPGVVGPTWISPTAPLQAHYAFRMPSEPPKLDRVAVMMPFSGGFAGAYAAMRGAVEDAGSTCARADEFWDHSVLIQDVFELIYHSSIVVCDLTGQNANVFYEMGIAHTLGKEVVPVSQSMNDVPFDIRHHRVLTYLNNSEGCAVLREALASRLSTILGRR